MTERIDHADGRAMARDLLFDLLGDFARHHGGEIRLRALVALAEEIGVPANTTRVVAGRLREDGWLEVRREGRESIYRLSSRLEHTFDVGDRRVFWSEVRPWDGRWSTVVFTVPANDRRTRDLLRKKLSWLGFGLLAPAVWISPHERFAEVAAECSDLSDARLDLLTMTSAGLAADRDLVERSWDLGPLNEEYARFVEALGRDLARYRRHPLDDATAHAERVRLVGRYRDFPLRDPDLPPELRPPGWLGAEARDLFLEVHALLAVPARRHYVDVVTRLAPATDMSTKV